MEGKNKKTKVFKWAAVMMLAAMMIVGCKQAQGSSSSGEENKKTETPVTPNTPAAAEKYAVTFGAGEHGTLKAKADGVTETDKSPISVEKDKTVTFTATANTGYKVDKWSISGSSFESGSGAAGSITAKVKVTANTTVNVTFKPEGGTPPPPPTPPASADKTYTVNSVNFTMKGIAAVTNGTLGHADYSYNNAVHTVSISAYRIGETEVTQELWEAVMGAGNNPSYFQGSSNPPDGSEVQEKRPVESVNWYKCIAFCNELTKKVAELGESQCVYTVDGHTYGTADAAAKKVPEMDMSKKGFRLPTEAEWEWAAMGGTEHKWAGTNVKVQLINYAWYSDSDGGNANNKTHEVKKKQANGYGLYDMSGNVWEWCWDWSGVLPNPMPPDYAGPAVSGSSRVVRGGCWESVANFAARAYRVSGNPGRSSFNLGLRVVSRP